jgi:hypothetical protein
MVAFQEKYLNNLIGRISKGPRNKKVPGTNFRDFYNSFKPSEIHATKHYRILINIPEKFGGHQVASDSSRSFSSFGSI